MLACNEVADSMAFCSLLLLWVSVCREFLPHMQSEIVALGDASMEQEVQTLLKLMHAPSTAA